MDSKDSKPMKKQTPKKVNPWMTHLKQVWAKQKGKMSYKECMQLAKKSYKKKN